MAATLTIRRPAWLDACRGPIPAPPARAGWCGCAHPLVWDGQAGVWRHLSDGTACIGRSAHGR
jgi:hypothetical protein